jgi:hypothetical protein
MTENAGPYFTVEKDHYGYGYSTVRVGEDGTDRSIKKDFDGLRGALTSGIRAATAEGVSFRYGEVSVYQPYLTIERTSKGWLVKRVEPSGLVHIATERMHPYGHLATAVAACCDLRKEGRMPVFIDLSAETLSTSG